MTSLLQRKKAMFSGCALWENKNPNTRIHHWKIHHWNGSCFKQMLEMKT